MELKIDSVKALVPKAQQSLITEDFVDKLNTAQVDSSVMDEFKNNFISYISVLRDGKYKMDDYLNAVKFVTYKLLNFSDIDAYIATFPERYDRVAEDLRLKNGSFVKDDVAPYACMYKKNKLVIAIFEQTVVPSHILNAPMYQEALNELSRIMISGKSEMARVNAATAILQHTKAPETKNIKLDIGMDTADAISSLREATEKLAIQQQQSIKAGIAIKEIAEATIIDAVVEELD